MNLKLIVKHAFGDHQIGDEITGADEMEAAKASHPDHVLQVDADAKAAPWISHEDPEPEITSAAPAKAEAPVKALPPAGDKS